MGQEVVVMPEIAAVNRKCNKCGETFPERAGFAGLDVCRLCDAVGAAGIAKRGEVKVIAEGK